MAKHKYIETPEKMWELFEEYREEIKGSPKEKLVEGNKEFIISKEKLERPLTMDGFEVWAYKKGFTVSNYFDNQNGSYNDYYTICHIIKKEIRADQIEGGMLGQYHHSITQRLNGLKEGIDESGSKELTIKVKYEQGDTSNPEQTS
jgi:hypothetical protein